MVDGHVHVQAGQGQPRYEVHVSCSQLPQATTLEVQRPCFGKVDKFTKLPVKCYHEQQHARSGHQDRRMQFQ